PARRTRPGPRGPGGGGRPARGVGRRVRSTRGCELVSADPGALPRRGAEPHPARHLGGPLPGARRPAPVAVAVAGAGRAGGGRDGRMMVGCWAGCPKGEVLAAAGLKMSNLWEASPVSYAERPKRTLVKAYDYLDERGALLFQVCRYEPKGFAQRQPDPKARDG